MKAGLYRGRVVHARHAPVARRFEYAHSMWAFDLDDPSALSAPGWLAASPDDGAALARFEESDHLPGRKLSLASALREEVQARLGYRPAGRILLLTQPRVFGVSFNPVSFFFCLDDGGSVEALYAEVRNTPWSERHGYALDLRSAGAGKLATSRTAKVFHVSPFLDMDFEYLFSVAVDEGSLRLGIANERKRTGERVFEAGIDLELRPRTAAETARALLRQPLGPIGVLARIHWQALRIALRGVPFQSHPRSHESHSVAWRDGASIADTNC